MASITYMSHMYGPRIAPRFPTVTAAFYHQVATQPEVVAARDFSSPELRQITYHELSQRASRLARKLRQLGVVPGDMVPLVVKRGIDMLVGIVAVLSCGAQYVPLDGGVVPDSTLRHVISQTGGSSSTVLVLKTTRYRVEDSGVANIVVIDERDEVEEDLYTQSLPPQDLAENHHGCYVIYTSGTTGTPKGVNVTHRNVTNLLCNSPGDLGITSGSRVGQVLNISFDMAAWEMLGSLCNGGTLVLRGSDWKKALKQVDVLICTPSILAQQNPEELSNIKTVATAGEASSQRLADLWGSHVDYYNCCGPTETTIVNTMHLHRPGEKLTIGVPTPNNNVYILDDDLQPVADGEPGLMWAGGDGVSSGYVQLPDKTAEKYLLDPFVNDGKSMMYNTGDLGRWLENGSIDIIGRQDDQVKLKGFRIELDGVTASLNACSVVDHAAVLLLDQEIHAFVAPETAHVEKVKEHMRKCQPYYANPTQYHLFDALPLTPNGKIDKKALKAQVLNPPTPVHEIKDTVISGVESVSSGSSVTGDISSEESEASSASSITMPDIDLEKAVVPVSTEYVDVDVPDKILGKRARGLRWRVAIVYRRLFSLVGIFNIAAAIALLLTDLKRPWLSNMTAINLLLAVMMRQDNVINMLYGIFCNVPKSWPLWIRARCAKIYHFGGVHSGAAVSSALWLLAANISDVVCQNGGSCNASWGYQSVATKAISWILIGGYIFMLVLAYPTMRKKYHDHFEMVHRFIGWTMLGLFWAQVVTSANDNKGDMSLGDALLRTPPMWMLVAATLCIASSWFWLRKVKVDSEVLSDHAIRLHFDYTVPVNGAFVRLSYKPLTEWHSFATIGAPTAVNGRKKGFSLVVSNAGDWTKKTIQNPPEHIWVRSLPTSGVMRIGTLFRRLVIIGTGSGIGPLLGQIQQYNEGTQLIWSTPRPEQTFGEEMCNTIRQKVPTAIIHDTKVLGRPDLVKMGYNAVKQFDAEAVIIIANEKITKKVVYGLEARGIYAFGAIWDS